MPGERRSVLSYRLDVLVRSARNNSGEAALAQSKSSRATRPGRNNQAPYHTFFRTSPRDNPPADQLKDVHFGRPSNRLVPLDVRIVQPDYEARPLNGIWATAPFLHNGSVPTLDALLRKAGKRPPTFSVGSRQFDTKKIGVLDVPGFPKHDTTLPGNSNIGHEFGSELSEEERSQLVEYLKSI